MEVVLVLMKIDALLTGEREVGEVYQPEDYAFDVTRHAARRDMNLTIALESGKSHRLDSPHQITISATEVENVNTFSKECTRRVTTTILACTKTSDPAIANITGTLSYATIRNR